MKRLKLNNTISGTSEFEKKNYSYYLDNPKNFLIFTKSFNKFGEFLNFLEFSKIFLDYPYFSLFFFSKFKRPLENTRKFLQILENPRKFKNSTNLLKPFVKIRKFLEFSRK